MQKEGVKLPDWVKIDSSKTKSVKNTDKLRRNQPAVEPEEPTAEEIVAEAPVAEATKTEAPEVSETSEVAEVATEKAESEEAPAETKEA